MGIPSNCVSFLCGSCERLTRKEGRPYVRWVLGVGLQLYPEVLLIKRADGGAGPAALLRLAMPSYLPFHVKIYCPHNIERKN